MPAPFSSPPRSGTSRILLVEPYDALAVAIAAALRRSVPGCHISVAGSLAQAELACTGGTIDLLVIDSDPPFAGVLAFFAKAKAIQPAMRVLIVVSEAAGESIEGASSAAFHFLAKPFAIDHFGLVVQALLQGVDLSGTGASAGTLQELQLPDVLRLHAWSAATAVVEVERRGSPSGEIHFSRGKLVHAAADGFEDAEAVRAMLRWQSPTFSDRRSSDPTPRGRIAIPWPELLKDAVTLARPLSLPNMGEFVERVLREPDERTLGATPGSRSGPTASPWRSGAEEHATNGHAAPASVTSHSSPDAEQLVPQTATTPRLLLPALVPPAIGGKVWAALTLDVMALRLCPVLHVSGIHGRLAPGTVSLHTEVGLPLPHGVFTFDGVNTDASSEIQILRLAPALQQSAPTNIATDASADLIRDAGGGHTTIQLMPGAATPTKMLLLASCEVVAVELSATFSLARLVLMCCGGTVRVMPRMAAPVIGAPFRISHLVQNDSAAGAEIMLEADA